MKVNSRVVIGIQRSFLLVVVFGFPDYKLKTEKLPTCSEQQCTQTVESFDLLLTSVVKIFCTNVRSNYSVPWQMKSPTFSTSPGFVIRNNGGKRWILDNVHGVSDATNILIPKIEMLKNILLVSYISITKLIWLY
ncbi:unnamed protein product [Didymodactylos carnosus]|uniref:Uncharacterized protein n=1 Tax=Didymodactylos carnosus TaxID=1234261 RepID=A0A814H788_9BILA|nr:unnamed protein product [Didymodactylos carnosus]CAF3777134.1 unnamed protein product [Didymodactylos carnosus]